ncbi:hypothetical protein AKO1_012190 [Acrasis kona]|uniref:DSBA-like thioredoxin domain-containing protein n=1 Tax=Acrasis kona TaxID=1008807 RepID=A0AAW2ZCY5_9EUKA
MAMKSYNKANFEITWLPYTLDPNLPVDGINKFKYWYSRGSKEAVDSSFGPTDRAGNAVGITFKYGGDVANTSRSHQLSEYARAQGKQNEVMTEMFADYHEKERNIGSIDVLVDAGNRAGLNEDETRKVLESESLKATVQKEITDVRRKFGATGVPFFVIDDQFGVSGARDTSTFHKIFDEVLESS